MISIIIPTKNEPLIQDLANRVNEELQKQKHEIIIVDKSDILPKVNGAKVIAQEGSGLGRAFLQGVDCSEGEFIVLMDGDGSHDPKDLKNLISHLDRYEMTWGSKLVKDGKTEDSFSRKIVTLGFSVLTRLILWIKIKDPMSGLAAYRREVIERVKNKLKPRGFKINLEIFYKSKPSVMEVPISFRKRQAGESTAGWNLRGLKEVLRILTLLIELRCGRLIGKW